MVSPSGAPAGSGDGLRGPLGQGRAAGRGRPERSAIRAAALAAVTLSLGACASITRGTDEQVTFQSTPQGASVTTSTGLACPSTPCVIVVPRTDQFIATFSKHGYAPQQVAVSTKLSGGGAAGLVGNVLVGGIIGVGVDAYNGASQDHDPNPVVAALRPIGSASPGRARRGRRPVAQAPGDADGM